MPDEIFTDLRLARLYDHLNPPTPDQAFYVRLAGAGPLRVLDVGSGTGRLAVDLVRAGHTVTGVEPSEGMLAVARARPGGERVRWIQADGASFALDRPADLAIMNGHVFQVFLTEADAAGTLRTIHRALVPGGRVAFETREPAAREWDEWTEDASREAVEVPGEGTVEVAYQVTADAPPFVTFETRYRFPDGSRRAVPSTLRFWTREEVDGLLATAGFSPARWLGNWDGRPPGPGTTELIAIAEA